MIAFTDAEKLKELRRELGQRRNVYPRLIANGRLKQERADRQMAVLEAVIADYEPRDLLSDQT